MKSSKLSGESQIDYRILVGLWLLSLAIYLPLAGRWCLSGDEFYTFEDSSFSIAKMLSFNSRPLYFIVCHYLLKWNPDLSPELVIRIPAVVSASLVAPCIYGLLGPRRFRHIGFLAALIAMLNPWLFQMALFGRYYAFVMLFGSLATVAALRFVDETHRRIWPILFFASGLLAAVSHPPAVLPYSCGNRRMDLRSTSSGSQDGDGHVEKICSLAVGRIRCLSRRGFILVAGSHSGMADRA